MDYSRRIELLKGLRAFLAQSFKGASFGQLKMDDAAEALDAAIDSRPAAGAQPNGVWTKLVDANPEPHARYLVRRADTIYTATPCYGMHEPWWVVKIMGEKREAEPVGMLPDDEWAPL